MFRDDEYEYEDQFDDDDDCYDDGQPTEYDEWQDVFGRDDNPLDYANAEYEEC